MSAKAKPPYRADHVGSLLRPPEIKKARAEIERRVGDMLDLVGLAEFAPTRQKENQCQES